MWKLFDLLVRIVFLFFSLLNRPESLIPDGLNQIISNSPAVYSLLLLVGRDIITFAIRAPVVFILEKKKNQPTVELNFIRGWYHSFH
jgi:hypothetical protein